MCTWIRPNGQPRVQGQGEYVYTATSENMEIQHVPYFGTASINVKPGFKVDQVCKDYVEKETEALKLHKRNNQRTNPGTMRDYGPPVIKTHAGDYDEIHTTNGYRGVATISSFDPVADQGIKWTGFKQKLYN